MLSPRRVSAASPTPLSPLGAALPRPASASGHASHTRLTSTSPGSGNETSDVGNVRVVVRIRPSYTDELIPLRHRNVLVHPTTMSELRIDVDPATLIGNAPSSNSIKRHPTFTFDHVLGEESGQTDLYDVTAKDVIEEYLKGHNVTFLAYGQTSSGKSYSMGTTGEHVDYSGTQFTPRTGLIPRTVQAIFARAEEIRLGSGAGSTWECRLSFLELYNEEIMDLLSDAGAQITIREERDGRIIWAGVQEVKVKTLEEVMYLLQDGSTRRRTGETGMNAMSSRSHAIFSLTMVQKKRAGLTASATQALTAPDTPKMLKRPASFIGIPRAGTPSGSRSGPPIAFAQKPSGILRPTSMMGHREDDFVVVTSKFNMVDLAGSERLKRTAAQGERMKEGISINSGLSALGNVISALSDPRSAKGHIPYRDSKLTRLLQDSIGGNALTTMIACVSPIEYNVAETLNTIKYASRARNIKNTSKVNAVEAGWDDVEHLQNTVIKLRKQLASLDTDGAVFGAPGTAGKTLPRDALKQSEKLIQRLAELQKDHTELYDRYLAKCNENMKLSSELKSAIPGDADALTRFNETVEPVILEYEKVVTALNIQLDDLRAQLSLLDTLYEEQGQGLLEAQERHTQSESYVRELQARAGKLAERNSSSEAYIADLEAKLKTHTENADGRSEIVSELRKEIAKLRESEVSLNQHATEIETRLAQSEDRSGQFRQQIERLERDAKQREETLTAHHAQATSYNNAEDNKLLLAELESLNRRIRELEEERAQLETNATTQRKQLEDALEDERIIQDNLRKQISSQATLTPPSSKFLPAGTPLAVDAIPTRNDGPQPADETEVLTLRKLIEEMSRKAADAENRYSEATIRANELQSQLVEIREANDTLSMTPAISLQSLDDISESGSTLQTPKEGSPAPSPSRSKRGSLPILSATGFTAAAKGGGFRGGRGYGESRRNRPQSLSQELSSAQQSLTSPRGSWAATSSLLFASSPSRRSMPVIKPLRTQQSMESELKFVHKVVEERDEELKQKDLYIRRLESSSLRQNQTHNILSHKTSASSSITISVPTSIPLPPSPDNPGIALPSEPSVESLRLPDTPSSSAEGDELPPNVPFFPPASEIMDPIGFEGERALRPYELQSQMHSKEASQRHIIEQQFKQIADLQKINLRLRDELNGGYPELYHSLETLRRERDELSDKARSPVTPTPASPASRRVSQAELHRLRDAHADELQAIITSHAPTIDLLRQECDQRVAAVEKHMAKQLAEYDLERASIHTRHHEEAAARQTAHDEAMAKARQEGESLTAELNASLASHDEMRRQLKMKADQALFELSRTRDEHQVQRQADAKQIADLLQVKADLREAIDELEVAKVDWMKRNSELEHRISRKSIAPPQGPPPNMPLPPVPSLPSAASSARLERSGSGSASSREDAKADPLSQAQDIESAVPLLPAPLGDMVRGIMKERDAAAAELDSLRKQVQQQLVVVQDAEQNLAEHVEKAQTLTRDLSEARKASAKLRAHLDESRQEFRRQQDECAAHMEELTERRQQVTRSEDSKRSERDSLVNANAQVAALKAQLEKAVDAKVNKKMGSRLKCF